MEETVKKQEQEQVKKPEQVIETVTNQTSFKPVRKRSEKQMAQSKLLGQNNVMLKQKKKERLLQELHNQQALHNQQSKSDVATIEEIEEVKEIEIVKDKPTSGSDMAFIGLILLAIIGCGVYCRYSSKPTITDVQPKEKVEPVKSGELVKSGIIDME